MNTTPEDKKAKSRADIEEHYKKQSELLKELRSLASRSMDAGEEANSTKIIVAATELLKQTLRHQSRLTRMKDKEMKVFTS